MYGPHSVQQLNDNLQAVVIRQQAAIRMRSVLTAFLTSLLIEPSIGPMMTSLVAGCWLLVAGCWAGGDGIVA